MKGPEQPTMGPKHPAMNGIASLLDPYANDQVESIWDELEEECGLSGVRVTPFPHFSWQVTEGYNLPLLESALKNFTKEIQPFTIHTDGLGIFSGEKPVVYISIFKDKNLTNLHSLLWEKTISFAANPIMQYSPAQWVPHITLAYNDLTPEKVDCVFQALIYRPFNWEIQIDNLIYISRPADQTAGMGKFVLGAG